MIEKFKDIDQRFKDEWEDASRSQKDACIEYTRLIEKQKSVGISMDEATKLFDLLDEMEELTTAHCPHNADDNI